MDENPSLLVIGAREGSLGEHVAQAADLRGYAVHTVGLNKEDDTLDITSMSEVQSWWDKAPIIDNVICTAGINVPTSLAKDDFLQWLTRHFYANVVGPMNMLSHWLRHLADVCGTSAPYRHHYVAISSNSDTIARTEGAGYCASKAALTMAMRCAAREVARLAGDGPQPIIYTYSPGWMVGTPMSEEIQERLFERSQAEDRAVPMHRIPGNNTVYPEDLAELIVHNLDQGGNYLNGTNIRLDGGDQ